MSGTRLAKLRSPALPRVLLARPALTERLDDGSSRRLTAVVAGAGYGKTTGLAAWAETAGAAWYSLDRADADVAVLLRGIVDALRLRLPGLPVEISDVADAPGAPDRDDRDRVEALVGRVTDVVADRIDRPQSLVLDNVEELPAGGAAEALVQALVRYAPPELRLVLASRAGLPFPIDRLRGRGEVLEIGVDALRLSPDEVRQLVVGIVTDASGDLLDEVRRLVGGWPAAVRLTAEALRDVPPSERAAALARLRRRDSSLSGFLAAEVLATHSAAAQQLLRTVAVLPYFTVDLASHLGLAQAPQAIAELESREGLLEAVADPEGCYAVTPLVGDCVRERHPLGASDRERVVREAAMWFATHRRYRDAVTLLVASHDVQGAATLLADHGAGMLAAGATTELADAAVLVPSSARSPTTEQVLGQALMVTGDWEGALACLQRITTGAALSAGVAWRIGLIHHLRGRLPEALTVYGQGRRTDGDSDMEVSLLHAMWASALWVTGQIDASRTAADAALALAEQIDEPNALSAAHTVLAMIRAAAGDRHATRAHSLRALDYAREAGNVLQEIRIRVNDASMLNEEGAYRPALVELDATLERAEVAGFAVFQALARSSRGDAHRGLGNLDEAMGEYQAALALCQRLGSNLAVYPLVGIADVHRLRGEAALARSAYEEAVAAAEEADDAQGLTPALAGLARCVAGDDPARAVGLVERALAQRFAPGTVAALLAGGWIALLNGDVDRAGKFAGEAHAAARSRGEPAGLMEALELQALADDDPHRAAKMVSEALRIATRLTAKLERLRLSHVLARLDGASTSLPAAEERVEQLAELGVAWRRGGVADAFGVLAADTSPVLGRDPPSDRHPPARVEGLGTFRVVVDGRAVADTAWRSRKARELLKLLVARRGQAVPRDVLCETLWPNEEPSAISNRLSAAMSVVRGVLDPDRRHAADYYVEATREALRLNLQHAEVDVEEFLQAADVALAVDAQRLGARGLLEAAAGKYTGECFAEDLYEDWAAPLREEARSSYLMVLRRLARQSNDPDVTVPTCLRLLGHDPYDEEAHLQLVASLARAGRHGEAHRHYRVYTGRMGELDIEPMPFPSSPRP